MDEIDVECLTQYHVNVSVLNKVPDWLAASVCVCVANLPLMKCLFLKRVPDTD